MKKSQKARLTNALLSQRGIYGITRMSYLNYCRELYRLTKQFKDQALKEKADELKQDEEYSQLDQEILRSLDLIIIGA